MTYQLIRDDEPWALIFADSMDFSMEDAYKAWMDAEDGPDDPDDFVQYMDLNYKGAFERLFVEEVYV